MSRRNRHSAIKEAGDMRREKTPKRVGEVVVERGNAIMVVSWVGVQTSSHESGGSRMPQQDDWR